MVHYLYGLYHEERWFLLGLLLATALQLVARPPKLRLKKVWTAVCEIGRVGAVLCAVIAFYLLYFWEISVAYDVLVHQHVISRSWQHAIATGIAVMALNIVVVALACAILDWRPKRPSYSIAFGYAISLSKQAKQISDDNHDSNGR